MLSARIQISLLNNPPQQTSVMCRANQDEATRTSEVESKAYQNPPQGMLHTAPHHAHETASTQWSSGSLRKSKISPSVSE